MTDSDVATTLHPVTTRLIEALGLGGMRNITSVHFMMNAGEMIKAKVEFFVTIDQAEAFASAFGEANLEAVVTYKEA